MYKFRVKGKTPTQVKCQRTKIIYKNGCLDNLNSNKLNKKSPPLHSTALSRFFSRLTIPWVAGVQTLEYFDDILVLVFTVSTCLLEGVSGIVIEKIELPVSLLYLIGVSGICNSLRTMSL